ncbi:hypothetical protein [Brevundimonas sp.]|uniref:hypothetical protein n=1 Tax=Brevundimonas sp. TaxID=1871086 RepID=UPI0035B4F20A
MSNIIERLRLPSLGRLLSPNVYAQGLSLASGLLVAFLFPILFGVAAYGDLLKTILPTLLIHRIADSMAEVLMPDLLPEEIFLGSLMSGALVGAGLSALLALFGAGRSDPLLLALMILTSTTIITFYRNQMIWLLVCQLAFFCTVFVGLSLVEGLGANIGLRNILVIANGAGAILGFALLAWRGALFPQHGGLWSHLWKGMRRAPQSLTATLMANTITVGYLWIAAPLMTSPAIGQLRILTSVVQASVSLFPIGLKAIFVRLLSHGEDPVDFGGLLGAAFWFFLTGFFVLQAAAGFVPQLKELADMFLLAVPFFWSACIERFAQAGSARGIYRLLNLVLCPIALGLGAYAAAHGQAVLGYGGVIWGYCVMLALLCLRGRLLASVVILATFVALLTALILYEALPAVAAGLGLVLVALLLTPPNKTLIRYYRGHI